MDQSDQNRRPSGKDEVTEAILDAADRLFSNTGPADVSLRSIAREANVNHGMVHRHFGTRDDLLRELLERMAVRWEAEVEASNDFGTALDRIMSTPDDAASSAGTWLRLVALSLLTNAVSPVSDAQEQLGSALRRLVALAPSDDDADAVSASLAALSLVYGWRFFHPYLRAALGVDGVPFEDLHDGVRRRLHSLIGDDETESDARRAHP